MFRKLCVVFVATLTLSLATIGNVAFAQMPSLDELSPKERDCAGKIWIASKQFAASEEYFRDREVRIFVVVAQNDLMCADPEWMGNVVILAMGSFRKKESWYGIFHIHILSDGTFRSAAPINEPSWKPMHPESGWWGEWCGFLKTVYPEDFAKQCKE